MVALGRLVREALDAIAAGALRVAPFVLLAVSTQAFALDADAALSSARSQDAATQATLPQLEVSASSLPRFSPADGASRSQRVDLTVLAPGASSVGVMLGVTNNEATVPTPGFKSTPALDLGFHWRHTTDGNWRFDVSAWRKVVPPDALAMIDAHDPSYGARVEMHMGAMPKNGFVADRGFLGLQLEGGGRLGVRRAFGGPMLYYRSNF